MSEMTVKKFSEAVGTPVDRLLTQMLEAGIKGKQESSSISNEEKQLLLSFLKGRHASSSSGSPAKVVLRRKSTMELTQKTTQNTARRNAPSASRTSPPVGKTVVVEVRKRRTYVKRSEVQTGNDTNDSPPSAIEEQSNAVSPQTTATPVTSDEPNIASHTDTSNADSIEAVATPNVDNKNTSAKEDSPVLNKKEDSTPSKAIDKEVIDKKVADTDVSVEETAKITSKTTAATSTRKKTEADKTSPTPVTADIIPPKKAKVTKAASATEKPKNNARPAKQKTLARKEGAGNSIKRAADERRKRIKSRIISRPSKTHEFQKPTKVIIHEVILPEAIAVSELARRMAVKGIEIIKVLMSMGSMVTMNQVLDRDTAALVVEELGHTYTLLDDDVSSAALLGDDTTYEALPRPPVVTIMGHVDHGKTSLLDYIRKTNVTAKESGGITQHIGAYHVELDNGTIAFLDTPGHAAFTAMRARGANVTDIIVIVVAADDGVMPQTVEAIQHAKAAGAPIIIAVNKMDRQAANPDKVKQELGQHEIIPEDWGGDTIFVEVSAKTGLGIDNLLDAILLQSEILELKAPVEGPAFGTVVESRMDKGLGSVITVLVQGGILRQGEILLIGEHYGRVRALRDEQGKRVKEAGPSIPIEVLGISGLPNSGDEACVVNNERKAREVALLRQNKTREIALSKQKGTRLEDIFNQAIAEGGLSLINLIIKADTQGSVEALSESLTKLSNDEVKVNVVASGVGGINESDITLAVASQAMMIGFNVRTDTNARQVAKQMEVEPRYYSVIYNVIDDITAAIISKLKPEIKEEITGIAEVRDVFRSSKLGAIAGCLVLEGAINRGNPIRVLRNHIVIYEGELESLRRFKDEANEVKAGTECGIGVKDYNDIKAKDQIEVFIRIETKRTL